MNYYFIIVNVNKSWLQCAFRKNSLDAEALIAFIGIIIRFYWVIACQIYLLYHLVLLFLVMQTKKTTNENLITNICNNIKMKYRSKLNL